MYLPAIVKKILTALTRNLNYLLQNDMGMAG